MKEEIKDFEKSRVTLERLLDRSKAQLTKTVAQLTKKKARHSNAAKVAKPKKVALLADIAKKTSPAKKKRLKALENTIETSTTAARELNLELRDAKSELQELKVAYAHYKAGFKAFDKTVTAHDRAVARKASKPATKRRVKRKVAAKK